MARVAGQGADIVPLVGARTRVRLDEARGSVDLQLTDSDINEIEQAVPKGAAAGERYASSHLAEPDSEKRAASR
jgi:aryl-alcohol dehydrogenase-like predicted oxidoreductase